MLTLRDVFADLERARAAAPLRLLRERLAETMATPSPSNSQASSRLRELGRLALVGVLAAASWTAVSHVTRSDSAQGGAPHTFQPLPEASPPPVTIRASLHIPAATVTSPRPTSKALTAKAAKPDAPPTITAQAGIPAPASLALPESRTTGLGTAVSNIPLSPDSTTP
jgi:hypothetical protein